MAPSVVSSLIRRLRKGPVAHTTEGPVQGRYADDDRIAVFAGVPYAAPPVGPLRWRPPEAAPRRSEPLLCVRPGPMAFQRAGDIDKLIDHLVASLGLSAVRRQALRAAVRLAPKPQSEDCLRLTIRTPVGATGLPVLFWIHGGDHTDGSMADPPYLSNALPERGCVLVTFNYRLGLFGFFAHPELDAESPAGVSGNYGLADQIAALDWVRANIAAFGGDPDRITVFGESAGGEATLNLLTSPAARGKFAAAIAQSPSDAGRWLHHDRPVLGFEAVREAGVRFATNLVGGGPGQLERLRALDAATMNEVYRVDRDIGRHFYPAVDDHLLPMTPMTAFSRGAQAPVPLIAGYNADEGSLIAPFVHPAGPEMGALDDILVDGTHVDRVALRAALDESFGDPAAVDALLLAYPGLDRAAPAAVEDYIGDHLFGVHVDHATRCHAAAGHPTWRYHFRALPPSPGQTAGAYHAAEVFHVFDSSLPLIPTADDAHLLTREMGDRWFAFAATHVPDAPGRTQWPRYDPDDPHHMVFDRPRSRPEPCPPEPGLDLLRARIESLNARVSR